MSFCPKCKSEYINGKTHCADCGTALVESLETVWEETTENNAMPDVFDESGEEAQSNSPLEEKKPERVRNFVSKKEKYKDYQSTGLMFLVVAAAGITVITLNLLGVITLFRTAGASSVLFYGVMYAMFIIFLAVGVNSLKNAAKIKDASVSEEAFLQELNQYVDTNITASLFDSAEAENLSPEELYFNRTGLIRSMLVEKYPDMDEGLLEQTLDAAYDRLFPS
ncbi:MAG: hypothetical protein NC086_10135 [Alistipes sp.]|nr:hypothetical protein [Alistipes sp.]